MRLTLLIVGAFALGAEEKLNPMRRVINILQKMQKEVKEEGEKEADLYEKFMCFCKGSADKMQKEMEENLANAKAASAQAEEDAAKKKQLEEELKEHRADRERRGRRRSSTVGQPQEALARQHALKNGEPQALGPRRPLPEHPGGRRARDGAARWGPEEQPPEARVLGQDHGYHV